VRRFLSVLSLVLLCACAPQEQPFKTPTQQAVIGQGVYVTSDGELLPLRTWLPKRPKAAVIALHGFNDYSNAFSGAGEFFKKRGIATYAYDQRGFGGTAHTGIWAGEENLMRDLRDFTALVKKRHPNIPVFVLGESMGGAVVMAADAKEQLPVSGIILGAPAVWGHEYMPAAYRIVLWSAAHTMPDMKMTGRKLKILASNNIPMLRRLGADPLVIKATRVDTIYGLTRLMDGAYNAPEHIQNRSLLLYGFKDQVIPRKPIESVQSRFKAPLKTIFYDDGYHMLTRDLQGDMVLADIAKWILQRH